MKAGTSLKGRQIFAPEMDYVTSRTIAAAISGLLGVEATILPTGDKSNLELGNKFTSGKECYPYIQTLSDILTFLFDRRDKGLGTDITLLMPQACGPCRFGQYIPALELVLKDNGFTDLEIISPSTADSYTLGGLILKEEAKRLRQVAWNSLVFGDVLNRMWWRARPYEKEKGQADELMEKSLRSLCEVIRQEAPENAPLFLLQSLYNAAMRKDPADAGLFSGYKPVLEELKRIGHEFRDIIDPNLPRKPTVAIIGEIYMRFHTSGNQNLVRELEKYGCETVTASMAEWVNYVTFLNAHQAKEAVSRKLRIGSFKEKVSPAKFKEWLSYDLTGRYQLATMHRAYNAVEPVLDIQPDHSTAEIMKCLGTDYHLDLVGEAVISIASAKAFMAIGFNGVVNCMPFDCMPSNNADEILRPLFQERRYPYLPRSYDQTVHPGAKQETAVFADNARRHLEARVGQKIVHNA